MGQVGNQSSNPILKLLQFHGSSSLHTSICICCLGVSTACHESGHHQFWAQVFRSFWLSAFQVTNMESSFSYFSFSNLFFCIAVEVVRGW